VLQYLPEDGITIIGDALHTHLAGEFQSHFMCSFEIMQFYLYLYLGSFEWNCCIQRQLVCML